MIKNSEAEEDQLDFVGWCSYCKDAINIADQYKKLKKHRYHKECYDTITSHKRGLEFK